MRSALFYLYLFAIKRKVINSVDVDVDADFRLQAGFRIFIKVSRVEDNGNGGAHSHLSHFIVVL